MKRIRWGIIGCGDVTEVKSGPAFNKVAGSALTAVMRRDAQKAADYAQRHQVPYWFSDADQLIAHPEVDAIYVATPPSTHAMYAIKAIEAGKAVYIEKPMARTYEECVRINQLAAEKNVPVMVAYYRRLLPGFVKVKALLDAGAIGDLRMVRVELFKHPLEDGNNLPWRVLPEIAGGGHFFDLASHQFDFLDFIFGPVKKAVSVVANQAALYPAEDVLSVAFAFENGVVGNGSWCFNAAAVNDKDVIEIIGSKGRIVFSTFDFVPVELITSEGTQKFEFPRPEHVQLEMIRHINAVLQGNEKAVSDGISGARTSKVLDEIVKSYYSK
jgi:predicted dehydrogenase